MKRLLLTVIVLIALGVTAIFVGERWLSGSLIVCEIQNSGAESVTQIIIAGAGVSIDVGSLEPGQKKRVIIRPLQIGGLSLSFIGSKGTEYNETIDYYLEPRHFGGKIKVVLASSGAQEIKSTVSIRWWPGLARSI
jgi:hypothetical protein